MPNQSEQSLPSTALTALTMPCLTSAPCQPPQPLSTMMPAMPNHQPLGHGVLTQAAISRTPPELNGIKWQQMALYTKKFVSGTVPLATKNGWKNGAICAKVCKNPTFPDQTVTFSGKAPALTNSPAKRLSVHQPASVMSALPGVTGQSLSDVLCDRVKFTESPLPLGEGLGDGLPSTLNSYGFRGRLTLPEPRFYNWTCRQKATPLGFFARLLLPFRFPTVFSPNHASNAGAWPQNIFS